MLQDFIVFICFLQHPSLMSQKWEEADWEEAESETKRRGKKERDDKKNLSREQYRKCPEEYEEDLDDDLSDADDKEIDEILDEYGVDEEDVIGISGRLLW